jgi:hypothetical protein
MAKIPSAGWMRLALDFEGELVAVLGMRARNAIGVLANRLVPE